MTYNHAFIVMKQVFRQFYPLLIAIFFGIACTAVSSYLLASNISKRAWLKIDHNEPREHEEHFKKVLPEVTFLSDTVLLNRGNGFGYQVFRIDIYSKETFDHQHFEEQLRFGRSPEPGSSFPNFRVLLYADSREDNVYQKLIKSSIVTGIGWPQIAFSTDSLDVGYRSVYGELKNDFDPRRYSPFVEEFPFPALIHWAGFLFNSSLFGTAFALVWILLTRKSTYCHFPRAYFISTCFGFWIAALVAWGSDMLYSTAQFLPQTNDHYSDLSEYITSVRSIQPPPAEKWNRFWGYRKTSFGYDASREGFVFETIINGATTKTSNGQLGGKLKLGWPAYSLIGQPVQPWNTGIPSLNTAEIKLRHISQLMALPVYWPGMIINWIFYSVMAAFPIVGIPRFIRWNRKRKHLCITCKYPLGEIATCPECGTKRG